MTDFFTSLERGLPASNPFVFDDDELDEVLYGKPGPGPTPACISDAGQLALTGLLRHQSALSNTTPGIAALERVKLSEADARELAIEVILSGTPIPMNDYRSIAPYMMEVARCSHSLRQQNEDGSPANLLLERTIEVARFQRDDALLVTAGIPLAMQWEFCGRHEAARTLWEEVRRTHYLQTPEPFDLVIDAVRAVWHIFMARDGGFKLAQANPELRKLIDLATGLREPGTCAAVATILNLHIRNLQTANEHQVAKELSNIAIQIRQQVLAPNHADLSTSYNNLGLSLVCLHEFDAAEDALNQAVVIQPNNAYPLYWLGRLYLDRGGPGDTLREARAWRRYLELGGTTADRIQQAQERLAVLLPE